MNKVFTVCIRVSGSLQSSYVFENSKAAEQWLKSEYSKLSRKYGGLKYTKETLPGLKVGDVCNVWGEAKDVFVIRKLICWGNNRYGFILDNGCAEEVAKCHTEFLPKRK